MKAGFFVLKHEKYHKKDVFWTIIFLDSIFFSTFATLLSTFQCSQDKLT